VQAADACADEDLSVPPLSDALLRVIDEKAPALAGWVGNPVDQSILAGSGLSGASVLEVMARGNDYDLLIANVGEDWVLGRPDFAERLRHLVERFAGIGQASAKPLAFVLGPADSPDEARWRAVEGARSVLVDARQAVFPTVERAAFALARWAQYWEGRQEG
jgi:acyl-CoA synthetase (NDP forming)